MKSAYELAMERLGESKETPLSEEEKSALADVDEKFRAKIAEREVFIGGLIAKARAEGNLEELVQLEEQLRRETGRLRDNLESEKEKIRRREN